MGVVAIKDGSKRQLLGWGVLVVEFLKFSEWQNSGGLAISDREVVINIRYNSTINAVGKSYF